MARPKPEILMKYPLNTRTGKNLEIVTCEGVYVVTYDGEPFNVRIADPYASNIQKYKFTVYVNSAHAVRFANKLNKYFKTDKFQVMTPTDLVEYFKEEDE